MKYCKICGNSMKDNILTGTCNECWGETCKEMHKSQALKAAKKRLEIKRKNRLDKERM